MYLVAVSGGPDSMYLLHKMIKKYGRKKIVAVCINYNFRHDSKKDFEIVKNFCNQRKIIFEGKNYFYNELNLENLNFENKAREDRFDFFKTIYSKYDAKGIFLAHHKDDWLESAIMQKNQKRIINFFGIKKYNFVNGMKLIRPFVFKYFKSEILKKLQKLKIDYAIDYTNHEPFTYRNKIRLELIEETRKNKNKKIKEFKKINNKILDEEKKAEEEKKKWEQNQYDQEFFKFFHYKNRVVYGLINEKFKNINLSSKKIEQIIKFIESPNRTSNYLLKKDIYLLKNKGKLIF